MNKLKGIVQSFQRQYIIQTLINSVPFLTALLIGIGLCLYVLALAPLNPLLLSAGALLLVMVFFIVFIFICIPRTARYKKIEINNVFLHLNREFPFLEESAQLVNKDPLTLNDLQKIQQRNIITKIEEISAEQLSALTNKLNVKASIFRSAAVLLIALFLILFSEILYTQYQLLLKQEITSLQSPDNLNNGISNETNSTNALTKSSVSITPPTYSKRSHTVTEKLDLTLLTGSKVKWKLKFSEQHLNYFLVFSTKDKIALVKTADNFFEAEKVITSTSLYQITSENKAFMQHHTLTVTPDLKPAIRILSPKSTITEFAKNATPYLQAEVQISDDFALSKIEIKASIAKGSGEGVKFRDQLFSFDQQYQGDKLDLFIKNWDLIALGMKPGDELYFTIEAWDNKAPNKQHARSSTKIIRWLEDENQGVLSDGVLIDFIPEYFKSQRQIIIETIELIEDRSQLSDEYFVETSELLGVAQSSLKQKYGKYLGDEFESGGYESPSETAGHQESNTAHIKSHDSEQVSGEPAIGNDHGHEAGSEPIDDSFEMNSFLIDRSGMSEQFTRFGHNHGIADIGVMAKQDPKALMKRSIANMWQAELHLMLSEPEKSLEFEQEALKYLKMAKKADRIYVKRLGFEPPPVTEKRRYQGELEDILVYQKTQQAEDPSIENNALAALYQILSQEVDLLNSQRKDRSSKASSNEKRLDKAKLGETKLDKAMRDKENQQNRVLNERQKNTLSKVSIIFEEKLTQRPILIEYIATIEKILFSQSFALENCEQCLVKLQKKVWQLMTAQLASPYKSVKFYTSDQQILQRYSEYVEEEK